MIAKTDYKYWSGNEWKYMISKDTEYLINICKGRYSNMSMKFIGDDGMEKEYPDYYVKYWFKPLKEKPL